LKFIIKKEKKILMNEMFLFHPVCSLDKPHLFSVSSILFWRIAPVFSITLIYCILSCVYFEKLILGKKNYSNRNYGFRLRFGIGSMWS